MSGADRIAAERQRQIDVEGYTPEHDAGHAAQLIGAANSYAAFANVTVAQGYTVEEALAFGGDIIPPMWPWSSHFWKPTGEPIRDLEKAGALIAAAIDSLEADA